MDSLGQAAVYQALRRWGPCFLRICSTPDALWVTDLGRRLTNAAPAQEALAALEVMATREERTGLWKLDWTPARYRALEAALPRDPPPFPQSPALEEAYALCRLLLLHPAPLARQPLGPVREALKLEHAAPAAAAGVIRRLSGDCAAALRRAEPLPALAGGVLCRWINQVERGMHQ